MVKVFWNADTFSWRKSKVSSKPGTGNYQLPLLFEWWRYIATFLIDTPPYFDLVLVPYVGLIIEDTFFKSTLIKRANKIWRYINSITCYLNKHANGNYMQIDTNRYRYRGGKNTNQLTLIIKNIIVENSKKK